MQCLATFRVSTSPLHRHCYSSQQDELRARPVRTRIAGQVRVRVMQAGQTRSCGARALTHKHPRTERCARTHTSTRARAHTHKHPRTETHAVCSHATCAAALPSGSPPAPSLSTQFWTVENCQQSNPTNFGLTHTALFSSSLIAHVLHSPPPPTRTVL
jgi:hypothetical protein